MAGGTNVLEGILHNYIQTNSINQLVLFGLDNSIVVGNSALEPALKAFLTDTRTNFPGIQIGAAASSQNFLKQTDPFLLTPISHAFCEDGPQGMSVTEIENLMNRPTNARQIQEAEMLKSVCRLASFSGDNKNPQTNGWEIPEACFPGFDFIFIEIEYWSRTQYTSIQLQNLAYENLKSCLYLGQKLKCAYRCVRNIDAEFNPRDIAGDVNYTPLTRVQQIRDCDFLMDQVMLVDYVQPSAASISFDYKCDVLHEFADRSTKNKSRIIVAYSAEKAGFVDCHGITLSSDFLGAYLDGTDPSNTGNMYSVESDFVTLLENQNYICPNCGCNTFLENHFTNTSLEANEIEGSIWFASSFMMSHNLSRQPKPLNSGKSIHEGVSISPNPSATSSRIALKNGIINQVKLININGKIVLDRIVIANELTIDNTSLPNGCYQLQITDSNNQDQFCKYIIIK